MAAYYYLSAIDTEEDAIVNIEERKLDFINYIAEIRRANNNDKFEIDNPSCFPGIITRLAQIAKKHPHLKKPETIKNSINAKIKSIILTAFREQLEWLNEKNAQKLLLTSLIYTSGENFHKILKEPRKYLLLIHSQPVSFAQITSMKRDFIVKLFNKLNKEDILEHLQELHASGYIQELKTSERLEKQITLLCEENIFNIDSMEYAAEFTKIYSSFINSLEKQQEQQPPAKKRKFNPS